MEPEDLEDEIEQLEYKGNKTFNGVEFAEYYDGDLDRTTYHLVYEDGDVNATTLTDVHEERGHALATRARDDTEVMVDNDGIHEEWE